MNNNQLYPFQRNRYYVGKLLTSADFQAEQDYYNNRERFMNSMMYGSGIVCGLSVVSLDDLSILVESGMAIDGMGREIILDTSTVKKLSAIEGFDELTGDEASLCIRYSEEAVHSVYAVNRDKADKEYEYSRISEGYQLFLMNKDQVDASYAMETEFLSTGILYSDGDYTVSVSIPSTVSRGRLVKMEIKVEKTGNIQSNFTMHGLLQIPGFATADGSQEISIDLNDVSLKEREVYKKEIWLNVLDSKEKSTLIILKAGTGRAFINDEAVSMDTGFEMKIALSDVHPRELVNREIGRLSLEMRNLGGFDEYIRLADINLVRTVGAYVIESIEENSVKKYIGAPAQGQLRADYMDYFLKQGRIDGESSSTVTAKKVEQTAAIPTGLPEIASGLVEIPLGNVARRGDLRYSGEVVHGLGKGNVYVSVGFESVSEDKSLGANAKSTIYGNADLFRKKKAEAPLVETAVKVLNDKGSFVVAAKLEEDVDYLVLTYRWCAVRFPAGNDLGMDIDYTGKAIIPETPTVVLETRESHFFGVRFENMDSCSLRYELTEEGTGEISADGIYTAPAKEGVYEIRIYCADMPVVCAYAYAIVKKKVAPATEMPIKEKESVLDDISI